MMDIEKIKKPLLIVLSVLLIICFVLLIVLTAKSCSLGQSSKPPAETTKSSETNQSKESDATLGLTADAGLSYQDRIIFVGDSTTAHLRSRGVLTGGTDTKQVWCPSNNTLLLDSQITSKKIVYPETGAEMTIAEASQLSHPAYMILTLGLNGIMSNVEQKDTFLYCYEKLVNSIKNVSNETKIIIQSIFPVSASCTTFSASPEIVNRNIDTVNGWLKDFAAAHGLYYLDSQSVLKDDTGMLRSDYDNGDGIHLTKNAYEILLNYIRTHACPD